MGMFRPLRPTRAAAAPGCLCVLLVGGCANPGQPKPPSLRLPDKAIKLQAERLGDAVILTWTTPSNTTDGDTIRGRIMAVVCRESNRQPSGPATCTPVQRVPATPGPSRADAKLPASLLSGPPTLLTYRVELLNERDRSAGPSTPAFAAAGAAPAPAGPLQLTARREGALIAWQADRAPGVMRVTRTSVAPDAPPAPAAAPGKAARPSPLTFGNRDAEATVAIMQPEGSPRSDPGGMLDRTVDDGKTYRYVGQRVRTVSLSGQALELHGLPSAPANLTFRNIFPPVPPRGLVSVPGGGFGEPPSVDLSWDSNAERDLLGYNIYRSDAAPGSPFTRLNPEPVSASAFRDLRAEPGHSYLYRVTAVDRRHLESAPGDTIHESLRK